MRFNEFNLSEDTRPWVEKSALAAKQDPADRAYQEKPAYQRKGVPEPVIKPAPGTKPTVDLSNPRQAAAYKAQLDLEKAGVPLNKPINNTVGTERPGNQAKPNYSLANDPAGKATAGEPTMGQKPNSVPSNVKPGIEAGAETGAKTLGKKLLGRAVPYASSAYDAYDAYNRLKKGDYVGAAIAGTGAVGGLVPGLGTPVALGAAGINMARDAYNNAPAPAPAPAPVAKPAPAPAEPKLGSWQEIAKLNNITDPRKLKAGSRIELPNGQGSYYVTKGDTLSGISQRLNTTGDPQYREPGSVNKTSASSAPAPSLGNTEIANDKAATQYGTDQKDAQNRIDARTDQLARIEKWKNDLPNTLDGTSSRSGNNGTVSSNNESSVDRLKTSAEENKSLNRIKSLAGLK